MTSGTESLSAAQRPVDAEEVASRSLAHAQAVAVVLQLQSGLARQSRLYVLRAARDRARSELAAAEETLAVEEAENALERNLTGQMIDMARMRFEEAPKSA